MNLIERLIDVLAPPECVVCGSEGEALCADCRKSCTQEYVSRCFWCGKLSEGSKTCSLCSRKTKLKALYAASDYNPTVKELVWRYKFDRQRTAASSIVELMWQNSWQYISALPEGTMVVSVPTATFQIRKRSFDHTALLGKKLAERTKLMYVPALRRKRQLRQLGAGRAQRLTQLKDTFYVPGNFASKLTGKSVLLIDDVATTGATLEEAARALKAAGARQVFGLVLSKRDLGD